MAQELGRQIRGEKDWRVAQANSTSTPGSGIRAPNGLSVRLFMPLTFVTERFRMEDVHEICRVESKLFFVCISYIGNRSRK